MVGNNDKYLDFESKEIKVVKSIYEKKEEEKKQIMMKYDQISEIKKSEYDFYFF